MDINGSNKIRFYKSGVSAAGENIIIYPPGNPYQTQPTHLTMASSEVFFGVDDNNVQKTYENRYDCEKFLRGKRVMSNDQSLSENRKKGRIVDVTFFAKGEKRNWPSSIVIEFEDKINEKISFTTTSGRGFGTLSKGYFSDEIGMGECQHMKFPKKMSSATTKKKVAPITEDELLEKLYGNYQTIQMVQQQVKTFTTTLLNGNDQTTQIMQQQVKTFNTTLLKKLKSIEYASDPKKIYNEIKFYKNPREPDVSKTSDVLKKEILASFGYVDWDDVSDQEFINMITKKDSVQHKFKPLRNLMDECASLAKKNEEHVQNIKVLENSKIQLEQRLKKKGEVVEKLSKLVKPPNEHKDGGGAKRKTMQNGADEIEKADQKKIKSV